MSEAYIFDAIRTPRGKGRKTGALHGVSALHLLVTLMRELQRRHDLDTRQLDDVLIGCVTPVGEQGANIARTAALAAGWGDVLGDQCVPGVQLNRFCASGLEAVNLAAAKVRSGWEEMIVAGGVESMSRVPMMSDGGALTDDSAVSAQIGYVPQGIGADLIATLEGLRREDVDGFAVLSQQRAEIAQREGRFKSIVPVHAVDGTLLLDRDEHPRTDTTLAGLGQLQAAFSEIGRAKFDAIALAKYPQVSEINHVHTAGNSSGIVDGATLVLVGSQKQGEAMGLKPRARVVVTALVGSEPTIMLTGPAPATRKALVKAGMSIDDIDLIECNEAFAAVVLKFMREMGLDSPEKVNVNGGSIALGHPLGATGAILLGSALDELERSDKETALITLCAAGGMGIATVIERV